MLNLRKTGNKSSGFLVLTFGFVYTVIEKIALAKIVGLDLMHLDIQKLATNRQLLYYSLAMDILGGAILGEFFFKRYIKGSNYQSRSVFPVLLIILAITFLLAYLMPYMLPKNSA